LSPRTHRHLIGCFCSEALNPESHVSGSGESFLFRLSAPPVVHKWVMDPVRYLEGTDVFMLSTEHFFAMGANGDFPGLKIDKELHRGSSHPTTTFDNAPLCGKAHQVGHQGSLHCTEA
jgi:hypothetical protein